MTHTRRLLPIILVKSDRKGQVHPSSVGAHGPSVHPGPLLRSFTPLQHHRVQPPRDLQQTGARRGM